MPRYQEQIERFNEFFQSLTGKLPTSRALDTGLPESMTDFCFEIVQLLNSITEFPTIQRKRRGIQLRNQPGPVLCLCVL